jgi:adenosylcobinamide-phosphate synthase
MMLLESMLLAFAVAVCADFLLGDPRNKFHPVAWLGCIIQYFVPKLKQESSEINTMTLADVARKERSRSVGFSIILIVLFGIAVHICAVAVLHTMGNIALVIFCALILKITIAIKGMEKHATAVMFALEKGDLIQARFKLSMIVKRDTRNLDEQHIISATIESIGENIVDGITSPLFYYSFLGPAGAFSYRITNTLDSMLGYSDTYHKDIGWMPALLDTVANYLPSRITAAIMIIAAKIVRADWRKSIQILRRDHDKTSSRNAGYPMAAMAGALRINLEKINYYSLGDSCEDASVEKCKIAISIMRYTVVVFSLVVCVSLITVLYFLGWWRVVFAN